ncbi:MAG: type I DNA topoisomerase [Bdellovibrionales bacterium]
MAKTASGKVLVIVESPTKAKTIRKFLGKDFMVESCMGHVRDLPQSAKDIPEKIKKEKWSHLGVNVDKDFDPVYTIPKNKTKIVSQLKTKLQDASELILATDEDREGESISWHLLETLKPKVPVKRMVFHEITKEAIEKAQKNFRDIDYHLVRAQEARRILDRLVGYTISPLIWKKVAYGLSAGRVQSVAVRLIAEREFKRMAFKKAEYWSVSAQCEKSEIEFETKIHSYKKQRIAFGKDFDGETGQLLQDKSGQLLVLNHVKAEEIKKNLAKEKWTVSEVEEKPLSRKPAPPFITSTLQQESNRKLGLGAREAMRVAQSLYEQGFITYMRTDSTFLSDQAIQAARTEITELYGKEYLPAQPRTYVHKKAKGAQEAHEAIRPAGTRFVSPEESGLRGAEREMYEMIWKRTMASQMVDSQQRQVLVKFDVGEALFSASGMTIIFPGFLKAYEEGTDEEKENENDNRLPVLKEGETVKCQRFETHQHETKPPARFTEASLIQTMEREGIGRPSTYAPTIATIMDRGYVRKSGSALVPTFTALVVNKLLSQHLPQYVDLAFTSKMEDSLDEIAAGELDSIDYLKQVYFGKTGLNELVKKQEKSIDADEARSIKFDNLKGYDIRVGRYGAYICRMDGKEEICASLPDAQNPAEIDKEAVEKLIEQKINGVDSIGKDPLTGKPVYVLTGRYGPYVQLGDIEDGKEKLKRVSIPPTIPLETVDFAKAQQLLALPKTLGQHTGNEKDIKLGIGRFGPYVVCDGDYRSIPKGEDFLEVTFERAMELFAQPKKGRGKAAPLKDLGKYPETEDAVQIFDGKYGLYIKCGKVNASLPEGKTPETITLEEAIELLAGKMDKKPKKAAKKAKAEKPEAAAETARPATKTKVVVKALKKSKNESSPKGKPKSKGSPSKRVS